MGADLTSESVRALLDAATPGPWYGLADAAPDLARALLAAWQERDEAHEELERLRAFAARVQRAHASPGCEREPLCLDYLGLLAQRVEETADWRAVREGHGDALEVSR